MYQLKNFELALWKYDIAMSVTIVLCFTCSNRHREHGRETPNASCSPSDQDNWTHLLQVTTFVRDISWCSLHIRQPVMSNFISDI